MVHIHCVLNSQCIPSQGQQHLLDRKISREITLFPLLSFPSATDLYYIRNYGLTLTCQRGCEVSTNLMLT